MRLNISQHMRLEQTMKLAPRIIQAMEILQLPILALTERIDAEMQSNPVLEMHEAGVDEEAPPAREEETPDRGESPMVIDEGNGHSKDFERLADFQDEFGLWSESARPSRPVATGERDRKMDAMANAPAQQQSLNEYLLEQWRFVEADERIKAAGLLIIDRIDDNGYLRTPLEELADKPPQPASLADLAAALKLVQMTEPIGVGARDLKECLLLQLAVEADAGRDVSIEAELVNRFLSDIGMNRLPQIAKRAGKTLEQVKSAIENISHLNPRPGSLISSRPVPVITPDVVVDLDEDGEVVITMPDGNTPRLYISRAYRRMLRNKEADAPTRRFVRKNVRSAEWIIDAIAQRRQTVHRVVEEVFKVQRKFLDAGREALKPLPMADVAGKVDVHVATVSRAVAGKYVQTPRGIFPLRMFFSGGKTTAEGQDVAWDAIRVKLREIIDAEEKSEPLNDDQLAKEMRRHGITIARRTVAKYRGLLDVPSARKRRQY